MKHLMTFLALLPVLAQMPAQAQDSTSEENQAGNTAMPIRLIDTLPGDPMLDELKPHEGLSTLSDEIPGCPITLQVTMSNRATAGGSASEFASAILAGGTLGLLPLVSNKDVILRYEVLVNGNSITEYEYTNNFTDAINIYSDHSNSSLEPKVLEWVKSTIPDFIDKFNNDKEVDALEVEYHYYFSE